jgi:hypothetical protein
VTQLCSDLNLHCFTGQFDDSMRSAFDSTYRRILQQAQVVHAGGPRARACAAVSAGWEQIVVTTKPCDYEGDYRTWEALASGAAVMVDHRDPLTDSEHPLVDDEHAVYFDPAREQSLRARAVELVSAASTLRRYQIARQGLLHACTHHRSVNRVDQIARDFLQLSQAR